MTTPTPCAPAETEPALPLPSIHMRALLTWIAVFVALSAVQTTVGPFVAGLPLPVRTLVITGVVVPAVVYSVVPTLLRVRAAVLRHRAPSGS